MITGHPKESRHGQAAAPADLYAELLENLGEERDKPARVDLDHGAGAPGAA